MSRMKFNTPPDKGSKNFKKLILYCKPYLWAILLAITCVIGGTVFTIIGPDKLKELTNAIASGIGIGIDFDLVLNICLILVFFYASSLILNFLENYIMATVTQKVSKKLRADISHKINKLPLKYFDNNTTGDVISRVTNDVDTISQTLNQSVGNLVQAIVMFFGSMIMMFINSWILALVAIGTSLIGFLFMSLIMKRSQKYFVQQQKLLGKINGHIEEVYSGHNVVKVYNAEEKLNKEFTSINTQLQKSSEKAQFLSGLMMPFMGFIGNLGYVAVCIVGAVLASNGIISFGVIVAFIIYVRLFTQPLTMFAQSMASLQSTGAASFRVFEFLGEKELTDESKKTKKLNDEQFGIDFKNVRFGYDEKVIIHNFSKHIKKGQKIAIVGPTGAGKTTIVNLLMRFYDLKQPKLIINGKITEHKVFSGGKSLKFVVNEDNSITVDATKYVINNDCVKDLPKNQEIKFNQNFDLEINDNNISSKLPVIVGDDLLNTESIDFGVAYYGDILIDGVPTKALTRENVHDLFCMVLQDTWLFDGSINDNIIYNRTDVSKQDVVNACKAVGMHNFIQTLPNKYDEVISENTGLSVGQKQLLTIARAMVSKAPILILDEATSSVDTRTEIAIQKAMDKLMEGKTSVVIAHRLSTIKNADKILVLKDGDVIESGNHEKLMQAKGFYAELYNSQFEQVEN